MKSNPFPSLSHPFPSLSLFPLLSLFRTFIKDAIFSHFFCFFFFFIYSIQDNFHLFFLFFFLCSFRGKAMRCVSYLAWLTVIIFPLVRACSLSLSLSLFFIFIVAIKRKSSIQYPTSQTIPFKLKNRKKKEEKKSFSSHFFFCARVKAVGKNMIIPCRR